MKLSTIASVHWYKDLDDMLNTLHECGYEALDYTGEGLGKYADSQEEEYCADLLEKCKKYNIEIHQTHAPFQIDKSEEEFLSESYRDLVIACIKRTSKLGVKYMVVHPYSPTAIEQNKDAKPFDYSKCIDHNKEINLKFFKQFIPYLKEYGVMICIENLFTYDILMQRHVLGVCGDPNETNYYIDELGEEYFGACYDSGHLNHFAGDEENYIKTLGNRLKVVHFNDSWGKVFHGMDWHLMPGQGDVDWYKIKNALKEIGYDGTINFEVGPKKGIFFKPQLRYMAEIGNALFND